MGEIQIHNHADCDALNLPRIMLKDKWPLMSTDDSSLDSFGVVRLKVENCQLFLISMDPPPFSPYDPSMK